MKQPVKVVLMLLRIMIVGGVVGGLTVHGHTIKLSQASAAESADVYISLAAAGGFPDIQGMSLAGQEVGRSSAYKSLGGGFKVGVFPQVTRRVLGIELEYFGTTGRLSAVNSSGTEGKAGLTVLNSMFNIVLRRPSGEIRPYGGFGLGYSGGILHGADFPGRSNQDFDSTSGFVYQFMGGLQWEISERTFLFAEYKHLVTDFHWKAVSLDYRANYALAGVGLSF
ncbi:MAG: outer membrane beta-barrel protein [Nitrospira sp.]|nr:outer membrane beta-barrel protein [Nitrospira sp.]